MTDDRKGRDAPEEKNLGRSPEDKIIGRNLRPGQVSEGRPGETVMARVNRENRERAEGKEAEPEGPVGPDGVFHVMQAELLMSAMSKDAPENQAPILPSVIHYEELRVKGDGIPPIDPTPPDPEAPIDSRQTEAVQRPKATQYPTEPDRRGGAGKRR